MAINIQYNGKVVLRKKFNDNIKTITVTNNGTENLFKYLCWHLVGSNTDSVNYLRPYFVDIKVVTETVDENEETVKSYDNALYQKVPLNGIQAYRYSALANNDVEIEKLTGKYVTEFNCAILGSNIQLTTLTGTYYEIQIYGQDKESLLAYAKLTYDTGRKDSNNKPVLEPIKSLNAPPNGELLIQWFMYFGNYEPETEIDDIQETGGNE